MNSTEDLIRKLSLIEALFAGATTEGEREAAANAAEKIMLRLRESSRRNRPLEYRFTFNNLWSRKLFVALLRRYGLEPFRYYRQRHTTVMVKVPKQFVEETLWPEFTALNDALQEHLDELATGIIQQVISPDVSEAAEVKELAPG